jgi:hypothetical protein
MRALLGHDRHVTWLLGVATLCLGLSVLAGRYHGRATDFIAGFFLGLSLTLNVAYLITLRRRRGATSA